MRLALLVAKLQGIEIELLTAASPPAGNPPNIRGVVTQVNCGTFKMALSTGQPGRTGVYSICHLIGFVPRNDD